MCSALTLNIQEDGAVSSRLACPFMQVRVQTQVNTCVVHSQVGQGDMQGEAPEPFCRDSWLKRVKEGYCVTQVPVDDRHGVLLETFH